MSSSSSAADLDVKVNEISIPAVTFNSPWITAARCALDPPIAQNCSFLHHSSSAIPDHFTSSNDIRQSVIVITSKYVRNVASIFGTINCPVNMQSAGRNKYATRNIDVNG
ncbi:hypothetical protein HanRHA438_Chr00c22g0853021 [Helianthus annuus]|nr:hypothetical protein HanRHA438_Chr00c22g0853021 [Helianthus annuus]